MTQTENKDNSFFALNHLEKQAGAAKKILDEAVYRNAVWEEALKFVKVGIGDLKEAQIEVNTAIENVTAYYANYLRESNNKQLNYSQEIRKAVDAKIESARLRWESAMQIGSEAAEIVVQAREILKVAEKDYHDAKSQLAGLVKQIQDQNKRFQSEYLKAKAFAEKAQHAEAVIHFEDLINEMKTLKDLASESTEKNLWAALFTAGQTKLEAQLRLDKCLADKVDKDVAIQRTKDSYDTLVKNRWAVIKDELTQQIGLV